MSEESERPRLFDRLDIILALFVGLVSLSLYARTLAPGVLPNDSGEFQVLAYQVGDTHTTGYPVYILLARLFISLFPVGDAAYRVNFFSAVMSALTVAGVYLCGRLLVSNRWAAVFGALALAVSYTFWSQSVIAEVYTAGAFFLAAVLVALLVWDKTSRQWALFLAGVFGGLGLGVHANLGIVAPAVGVFLLLDKARRQTLWKPALLGALAGVVLFLACFVVVDLNAPPANVFNSIYGPSRSAWDMTEDDFNSPVARIVFLVTARQWRGALFTDPQVMPEHLSSYLANLPREFSLFTLGLAALGLVMLVRKDRRLAALFGTALMVHWVFYFNYRVGDIYVFYIPGYALMALLAAVGLEAVIRLIDRLRFRGKAIVQAVVVLAIAGAAITPVLSPYWGAVIDGAVPFLNDRGFVADPSSEMTYKIAANIVRQLDENSILFTNWNQLYLYYYAAHVEQGRTDLQFVETYPHAEKPGLAQSVIEFIEAKVDTHPIYFSDRVREVEKAGFTVRPANFGVIRLYKVER